jgi:glycosyltransferase involved in cell wall biosynthesis
MLETLLRIRHFVLRWRPDVVHAHMIHANLIARLLTRICHVPATLCTAHSFCEGNSLRMLCYRLTDRWADLTTQVSDEGRQRMIEVRAAPEARIIVTPNGIDTRRFRPDAQARAVTRAALGLGPEDRLVLNVGRLVPDKAQGDLIDAFAAGKPDAHTVLMIAGEGPQREALARRVDSHGLAGKVRLLGQRSDIPDLLNAADLFVLSSRLEGMPLVVGEALASGCPVVATDASGVRALLGDLGTLVRRGDAPALTLAIRDAIARGRGSAADETARHQHIATAFNIEVVALRWLHLYAKVMHADPTPALEATDAAARYP